MDKQYRCNVISAFTLLFVGNPSVIGKVRVARQNEAAGAADAAAWVMSAFLIFQFREFVGHKEVSL